jgi:hypothetical protein
LCSQILEDLEEASCGVLVVVVVGPIIGLLSNYYYTTHNKIKQGHTVALPFTLKSILMQKKNYGNSNISPCKNIIFQKSSQRNPSPSRYYNFLANLKFQHKLKYHLSKILR